MPSISRHVIAVSALAAASPASAQTFQDIAAIEQRVVQVLGAAIGTPGGPARPVDRRLRLSACPAELIVEPVVMNAVTVRCQAIGWRIRVPVMAAGAGQEEQAVAAPTSSSSAAPVRTARAQPIIRRGDPVALVVVSGGFTVSRQAVAEQDGAPGDRIRVRTEPRKPPIIGQVLPDGRVAMNGFN